MHNPHLDPEFEVDADVRNAICELRHAADIDRADMESAGLAARLDPGAAGGGGVPVPAVPPVLHVIDFSSYEACIKRFHIRGRHHLVTDVFGKYMGELQPLGSGSSFKMVAVCYAHSQLRGKRCTRMRNWRGPDAESQQNVSRVLAHWFFLVVVNRRKPITKIH